MPDRRCSAITATDAPQLGNGKAHPSAPARRGMVAERAAMVHAVALAAGADPVAHPAHHPYQRLITLQRVGGKEVRQRKRAGRAIANPVSGLCQEHGLGSTGSRQQCCGRQLTCGRPARCLLPPFSACGCATSTSRLDMPAGGPPRGCRSKGGCGNLQVAPFLQFPAR
jgi:hypothetical protein